MKNKFFLFSIILLGLSIILSGYQFIMIRGNRETPLIFSSIFLVSSLILNVIAVMDAKKLKINKTIPVISLVSSIPLWIGLVFLFYHISDGISSSQRIFNFKVVMLVTVILVISIILIEKKINPSDKFIVDVISYTKAFNLAKRIIYPSVLLTAIGQWYIWIYTLGYAKNEDSFAFSRVLDKHFIEFIGGSISFILISIVVIALLYMPFAIYEKLMEIKDELSKDNN